MKKTLLFLLFGTFISNIVLGQCTFNAAQYGSATAPTTIGQTNTVSTCNYLYEYSPIDNMLSSNVYSFDINVPGYITVFDGSFSPIAAGNTPFQFTPPADGTYNVQWNGPNCATDFNCYTTSVTLIGPSAPCNNPASGGTTAASVVSACPGQNFLLSLNNATSGSGLTYQWQASSDGINFFDVLGATGSTYSTSQTSLTYYRCGVTCSGGTVSYSTPLALNMGDCIIMSNGSTTTCSGTFYDSGGGNANYMNAENYTYTISPGTPGSLIQVNFTAFQLETCCDNLTIYNGNSTAAPMLGSFTSNPGSITSSAADGSLTFVFYSDFSVVYTGWQATVSCITPPSNDDVCSALSIPVNGVVNNYNNGGAGTELGESTIAPPATGDNTTDGWGESTISSSVWFKFNAPASGNITINCTDVEFDGQVAVYETSNCSDFNTFNLIGANDNSMTSTSAAPNFTICGLTPSSEYYLMYDSRSAYATGAFALQLSELSVDAGIDGNLLEICSGDTIDLFNGISGNDTGGTWYENTPSVGLNDNIFNSAGLAYQIFTFDYVVVNGCATDTSLAQVKIFGPSSAGNDGTLQACTNASFNLLDGLSGTVDLGGTWYNPSNQAIVGNSVTASNIPGQYNYDYITGNGVCPNDTANVLVTVVNCPVGIEEMDVVDIVLYPNPASDVLFVTTNAISAELDYQITNTNGQLILSSQAMLSSTSELKINLSSMDAGVYFIHLKTADWDKTLRFVKQ
jgi:hypothetical protein